MEVVVGEVVGHVACQPSCQQAQRYWLRHRTPEEGVDGDGEADGEDGGKNKAHGIHGEEVVNAMEEEVEGDAPVAELHPLIEMEEPSVECVLEERPEQQPLQETEEDEEGGEAEGGDIGKDGAHHGHPHNRYHVPRSAGEEFEEVVLEEARGLVQHLWCVDEFVVLVTQVADLHDDGLVPVEIEIRALPCRTASIRPHSSSPRKQPNLVSIHHRVRDCAMHMPVLVLEDFSDVGPKMRKNDGGTARMLPQEFAHVIHLPVLYNPGIAILVVFSDLVPFVDRHSVRKVFVQRGHAINFNVEDSRRAAKPGKQRRLNARVFGPFNHVCPLRNTVRENVKVQPVMRDYRSTDPAPRMVLQSQKQQKR
mmetsp:Transcript_14593/g.29193  ORF Transcript_14593/g.29193 Transcript_14593/m.29193 type:complete len:364 (-) Transcript_14593:32-1123(-)